MSRIVSPLRGSRPRRPTCTRRGRTPRRRGAHRVCRRGPPSTDEAGESEPPHRLGLALRGLLASWIVRSAALGGESIAAYVARSARYVEDDDPSLLPAFYEAAAVARGAQLA